MRLPWVSWHPQTIPIEFWHELIYRGESYDAGKIDHLNDSLRLNMMATYVVSSYFSIYIRGENLTNNQTPEVIGWAVPGAAVYGGFRLQSF